MFSRRQGNLFGDTRISIRYSVSKAQHADRDDSRPRLDGCAPSFALPLSPALRDAASLRARSNRGPWHSGPDHGRGGWGGRDAGLPSPSAGYGHDRNDRFRGRDDRRRVHALAPGLPRTALLLLASDKSSRGLQGEGTAAGVT